MVKKLKKLQKGIDKGKNICYNNGASSQELYICESGGIGRRARLRGVWATVRVQVPFLAPTKKELLSTKSSFFVYPSRRLGISSPHEVRCISSAPLGLYLITRQRASSLRLDDIQTFGLMIRRNKLRMIYKATP